MTQDLSKYRELRNENLWTPQIVYDVPPPNDLVRDSYLYGEGTDNVNQEEANNSLLAGASDFFSKLLGGIGSILAGAVEAGVGLLSAVVDGVVGLVQGIANAIGNLFGGSSSNPNPPPLPPIFNPIKTNLEQVLGPKLETVDVLLEDSAALGDESTTIQQQMRDLIDPTNPDSKLFYALAEVDRLASDRLDLQEEALGILRESVDSLTEYISRSMFVPDNQPVSDEYFDVVAHPTDGNRWRVIAKPGWVGHYVWQSVYYFTSGDASPVLDGREVGFTRQWDEYAWGRNNSILTYWVKKAQYATDDKIGGAYISNPGTWTPSPGLSFTATETSDHDLFYRVTWENADRGTTYGHRITKNGAVLFQWGLTTSLGPSVPWESGVRARAISEFKVPLVAGDVLSFETYSTGNTEARRQLSSTEQKVGWLVEPKS
ncbi:MAG: hypothetical protein PHW63_08225 [Alphaproteobacteria bacterium]|nr:hypothetical protein [Alphaproteobacteria bacterium]